MAESDLRVPHINENLATGEGRANDNWHRFFDEVATKANKIAGSVSTVKAQVYGETFTISQPEDQDYDALIDAPFGFTISSITSKCRSGTCTATFKIGGTALGGTANSVSSTEDAQEHTSDNEVAIGDDLTCTISANSSCLDAIFTIKFTRT